jgi:hypothetical protein
MADSFISRMFFVPAPFSPTYLESSEIDLDLQTHRNRLTLIHGGFEPVLLHRFYRSLIKVVTQ